VGVGVARHSLSKMKATHHRLQCDLGSAGGLMVWWIEAADTVTATKAKTMTMTKTATPRVV